MTESSWFYSILKEKNEIFEQNKNHFNFNNLQNNLQNLSSSSSSISNHNNKIKSRYFNEFNEIAMIGWGGGGEVWMAIHKLDQRIYAVKKISLSLKDIQLNKKLQREVTTISRLTHLNIVRYYASWVEETFEMLSTGNDNDENENNENESNEIWSEYSQQNNLPQKNNNQKNNSPKKRNIIKNEILSDHLKYNYNNFSLDDDFEFEDDSTNNNGIEGILDRDMEESDSNSGSSSDSSSSSTAVDDKENDNDNNNDENENENERPRYQILYIQMEYCHATLQDTIVGGNICKNPMVIYRLFRQLLEATKYIHSTRVIHRDFKVIHHLYINLSILYLIFINFNFNSYYIILY